MCVAPFSRLFFDSDAAPKNMKRELFFAKEENAININIFLEPFVVGERVDGVALGVLEVVELRLQQLGCQCKERCALLLLQGMVERRSRAAVHVPETEQF